MWVLNDLFCSIRRILLFSFSILLRNVCFLNIILTLIRGYVLCLDTMLFQCEPHPRPVLEPQGLPVDDPSSAADVVSNVDNPVLLGTANGLEPALDIGSATRGRRLVSTSQVWADHLLEQPHTLVCGCSYVLPLWFIFFHFCQPNLGRLWTDLAEIWHADRKLV